MLQVRFKLTTSAFLTSYCLISTAHWSMRKSYNKYTFFSYIKRCFIGLSPHRMLLVYPQTKTYFSHWPDTKAGSEPVKKHGKKIMGGVGLAVSKIDDLAAGLLELSELHAFKLRVDPANFKVHRTQALEFTWRVDPGRTKPVFPSHAAPGALPPGGHRQHVPQGFHPGGPRGL